VLARDTLRSAADLGLSMVAVTLVSRAGYFRQSLDAALAARSSWPAHTIRMVWPADAAIKGRNRVRRSTIGWPEVGVRTTPGVMQRKSQWRLSVLRQTPGARSGRVCALTNGIRSGSPE